jgi:hypothetical protein
MSERSAVQSGDDPTAQAVRTIELYDRQVAQIKSCVFQSSTAGSGRNVDDYRTQQKG